MDDTVAHRALMRVPSPTWSNKAMRGLWSLAYAMLFRLSPTPFHAWRRAVLRLFRANIADNVAIYPSVRIWAPWNLQVGAAATIGAQVDIYNVARISVGESAVVSQKTFLCSATHDFNSDFQLEIAEISVGRNAWIAADAFVGPGVEVGEGAVVGARAVVVRAVAPWSIVAGNPARIIGSRNRNAKTCLRRS